MLASTTKSLLTTMILAVSSLAQTSTGSVNGNVTDPTGAAAANANIVLESIDRGERRTAQSNGSGYYEFLAVLPGPYRINVSLQGFNTTSIDNVIVRVGAPYTANVALQVGQVNEQVTVEAATQQVNATDAQLGNVIEQREAHSLPIRGRSFLEFATLSAGAISKFPGSWTSAYSGGRDNYSGVSISGAKDVSTVYLLDGVASKSPEYGQIGYLLPLEAVQEFNTQRGFFSSRYSGPAVINVASVAGSNEFHGVVWHSLRNDMFNARNFFDRQSPAPLRQNMFGARAAGRLVKDKLFWMGNFQILRERRYQTLQGSAPTERERNGDFSLSRSLLTGQPSGVVIVDPVTKAPMPGNMVPRSRFDDFAVKYMAYVPPALDQSLPFGQVNRVLTSRQLQNDRYFDLRGDYVMNDKTRLYARYSWANSDKIFPTIEVDYGRSAPYDNKNGVIGLNRVITPNTILEFHFGYDRVDNRPTQAVGPGIGVRDFHTELGLQNVNQFTPCKQPPWVNLNFASFTSQNCVLTLSNNYTYQGNLALVRGRHSLNMGAQFVRVQVTNPIFNAAPGSFRFTGQFSGNPFADYLFGAPYQATALTLPAVPYRRTWQSAFYLEDRVRVSRTLTLSFGLRYELPVPPHDKYDKIQAFRPASRSGAPNTPYEILLPNQNGASRKLVRINYKDFAPRFGFAWKPGDSTKWAVRGSYGIFYETLVFNEFSFMSLGYPIVTPVEELSDATIPTVRTSGQFALGGEARLGGFQLSLNPDRRDPYLQQWTMSIERELPGAFLLSTAYVGNSGVALFKRFNFNVAHPGPSPLIQRLPFPDFGGFIWDSAEGHSTYHGWQTDLNRRFRNGFSFRMGYTWSRAMDNGTNQGESYVPWNSSLDKGRINFDVRHRLVLSGMWDLPFGRGKRFGSTASGVAQKIIGGWQFMPIAVFQSGFPFHPTGLDLSNTAAGTYGARVNRIGDGTLPVDQRTRLRWYDVSAFKDAPVGELANSGTRFLDGPGMHNWDASLVKNTPITERVNLQLRFEYFNLFNRTNFGLPTGNINSPTAGQILSAGAARELQFVTRLTW